MACCSSGYVPCFGGDDADADNTSSRYRTMHVTCSTNLRHMIMFKIRCTQGCDLPSGSLMLKT